MTTPCNNSPDEVIEKIVSAKANSDKFDKFVNGADTQTVQLGAGSPTPTIRNAVRQVMADASWAKSFIADAPEGDVSLNNVTTWGTQTSRTLADRFSDIINVKDFGAVGDGVNDDTEFIKAAIVAANQEKIVYFPIGTYVALGNLPGINVAKKAGDGIIKRGDYTFTVCPKSSAFTNTIYVSPTGNYSADGISPDKPSSILGALRYIQHAMSEKGSWIIHFLPGTYTDNGIRVSGIKSFESPIIFEGEIEKVSVGSTESYQQNRLYFTNEDCTKAYLYNPDTWETARASGLYKINYLSKWDGEESTEHYAIRRSSPSSPYGNFIVRDLWFTNWHIDANSGALCFDSCDLYAYRNRYYNCGYGEWNRSGYSLHYLNQYISCTRGCVGFYSHSGNCGNKELSCLFYDCETALNVSRASVMHCDYNIFDSNNENINAVYVSRVALLNSVFVSWTQCCFHCQNCSMVTNAESCTYLQVFNASKPLTYGEHEGWEDNLPAGCSPKLNSNAFPFYATLLHTGTTDRTFLTNNDYGRLFTISPRFWEVKGDWYSSAIVRLNIRLSFTGTGTCLLEVCSGASENSSIANVTLPSGSYIAGWLRFEFYASRPNSDGFPRINARVILEDNNSDVHVILVNNTTTSSTTKTYYSGKSVEDITMRLYGTLSNATDTLTIYGWYCEISRS